MVLLRDVLSILAEDTTIDLVDKDHEEFNGDSRPSELLKDLSDNLLNTQVIKVITSNEFTRCIEIMLNIDRAIESDVRYPKYKRKYFGGKK